MNQKSYWNFVLQLTLLGLFAQLMKPVSAGEDLTLTKAQKQTFDKFKNGVQSKLYLDFMKNDVYLIKWLRAKNFDVRRATEMFMQHLKWRKDYKLDTIHQEDFSEFEKDYPTYREGVDQDGQPIYAVAFGEEWDVRKAAIAGKLPQLTRWLFKGRDEVVNKIYAAQREGKNITQWNLIVNLDKLNQLTHLCTRCLSIYTDFATSYEFHYPGTYDKLMLVSAPTIFDLVLGLIKPILSPQTSGALKVFSSNRAEWEAAVFKGIDRNQMPPEFGGTKIYT